jgi:hypothetical protein
MNTDKQNRCEQNDKKAFAAEEHAANAAPTLD